MKNIFKKRYRINKAYSLEHVMYFYYVQRTILGFWVQYDFSSFSCEDSAKKFICHLIKKTKCDNKYIYVEESEC